MSEVGMSENECNGAVTLALEKQLDELNELIKDPDKFWETINTAGAYIRKLESIKRYIWAVLLDPGLGRSEAYYQELFKAYRSLDSQKNIIPNFINKCNAGYGPIGELIPVPIDMKEWQKRARAEDPALPTEGK